MIYTLCSWHSKCLTASGETYSFSRQREDLKVNKKYLFRFDYFLLWSNIHYISHWVQQSDPLAQKLFSIGIDNMVQSLKTEFKVWYSEDGTIGDSRAKVISFNEGLIIDRRKGGLEVIQRRMNWRYSITLEVRTYRLR